MALNYQALNPKSILRDALIDPSPDLLAGLSYHKIFGIPGMPNSESVSTGRSVDLTGAPGLLHGKLLSRSSRDLLGAAAEAQDIAKPINSPRDTVERFALTEIPFSLKQFDGRTVTPVSHYENGFLDSATEEIHMVQRASASVHMKLERACAAFFIKRSAEAATADFTPGGWTDIDWQAGGTGGTPLDSSSDALQVLSSIIRDARLRAGSKINAAYMGRRVLEKFSTEPSILGRSVVGDKTKGVAMSQGYAAASMSQVVSALKEYLELDEIIVSSAIHQNQNHGQAAASAYIWDDDRMWIGNVGDVSISTRSNSAPRVLNNAGAFCSLVGKMDVRIGEQQDSVMPQYVECVAETFVDMLSLDQAKGTLIYNMG